MYHKLAVSYRNVINNINYWRSLCRPRMQYRHAPSLTKKQSKSKTLIGRKFVCFLVFLSQEERNKSEREYSLLSPSWYMFHFVRMLLLLGCMKVKRKPCHKSHTSVNILKEHNPTQYTCSVWFTNVNIGSGVPNHALPFALPAPSSSFSTTFLMVNCKWMVRMA